LPAAGFELACKFQRFQPLQPRDQEVSLLALGGLCRDRAKVHEAFARTRLNRSIQARPTLLANLAFGTSADLQLSSWAEPFGGELAGSKPHAAGQVTAIDHQVSTGLIDAAEDYVDVRIVGIPVIDGNPFETGAEVDFHPLNQLAGECSQVFELVRIFRRHDEAELMPILASALLEGFEIGGVALGVVAFSRKTVSADAFARKVAEMRCDRARPFASQKY
jgi:hypothetical protein